MTINIPVSITSYVLSKKKYADLYSNRLSSLVDKTFRDTVFSLKSFLSGNKITDKKLYIPLNFARLVSGVYADEEMGQGWEAVWQDENFTNMFNKMKSDYFLDDLLLRMAEKKSAMGYSIVRVRKSTDRLVIEKIPVKNYYPMTDGLSLGSYFDDIRNHYILSIVKEGNGKSCIYVDAYTLNDDNATRTGTYGKYAYVPMLKNSNGLSFGEPITEPIIETLPYLPLFVFNNDIINDEDFDDRDNTSNTEKQNNEYLGESDYADIVDIIQEMNDRASQISVEFVKNLTSKISLPKSIMTTYTMDLKRQETQQKKNGEEIERPETQTMPPFEYFTHAEGETPAQYIGNPNSYIDKAMDWMTVLVRYISAITRIPVSRFGLEEKSGNVKDGTMRRMNEAFFKKIERKRMVSTPIMQKMFAYIIYLETATYAIPTIIWPKNIDLRFEDNVASYTTLKASGLVSTRTAMQKVLGIDGQELDDEIQRIQDDNLVIGAINPGLTSL